MESLQDILAAKQLTPPDEIGSIKDYVKRNYSSSCSVKMSRGTFILSVPNAALAATLQLERQKLIEACNLKDKKLFIRNSK
ncbi:MAG TPA: hypothetical protein VIK37_02735 [Candidatus Saccharimonadales bacterium]